MFIFILCNSWSIRVLCCPPFFLSHLLAISSEHIEEYSFSIKFSAWFLWTLLYAFHGNFYVMFYEQIISPEFTGRIKSPFFPSSFLSSNIRETKENATISALSDAICIFPVKLPLKEIVFCWVELLWNSFRSKEKTAANARERLWQCFSVLSIEVSIV